MWWLRLVGSLKSYVCFAKEPYKRGDILQKKPIILRSLLIVATPCTNRALFKKRPTDGNVGGPYTNRALFSKETYKKRPTDGTFGSLSWSGLGLSEE